MNNCGNCKNWGRDGELKSVAMYCQKSTSGFNTFNVLTFSDMSCPRFERRAPELPEALKKWVPKWKNEKDLPENDYVVLTYYASFGVSKLLYWEYPEWRDVDREPYVAPDFWCELP